MEGASCGATDVVLTACTVGMKEISEETRPAKRPSGVTTTRRQSQGGCRGIVTEILSSRPTKTGGTAVKRRPGD